MDPKYTHITAVLDRSGSMENIAKDMIGGFNSFLADQKALPGKATLTLIKFDGVVEVVHEFKDLQEVNPIDRTVLDPRGRTALHDAIGIAINQTGQALSQLSEDKKPAKVVLLIITDGEENDSKEFSQVKIAEMIKHQTEAYSWNFVFLGANQDAVAKGKDLGIAPQSAMSYAANAQGAQRMMRAVSKGLGRSRAGGQSVSVTFDDEDRQEQTDAGA